MRSDQRARRRKTTSVENDGEPWQNVPDTRAVGALDVAVAELEQSAPGGKLKLDDSSASTSTKIAEIEGHFGSQRPRARSPLVNRL